MKTIEEHKALMRAKYSIEKQEELDKKREDAYTELVEHLIQNCERKVYNKAVRLTEKYTEIVVKGHSCFMRRLLS